MLPATVTLLLRTALCVAVGLLAWHRLGPFAVAILSPLAAVVLRGPIIEFFAAAGRHGAETALAARQGRHYEHRGAAIDVVDDEAGHRWLLTADVRKALPALPRDQVLQRLYGVRAGAVPDEAGFRIRADALMQSLAHAHDPGAIRFKRWLDGVVVKPAERARG